MAIHKSQIPSPPAQKPAPYPGDGPYLQQARLSRQQAQIHGSSLPPEPGNLSMHELAQWYDRTLTGSTTGFPMSPDTSPVNTTGLS